MSNNSHNLQHKHVLAIAEIIYETLRVIHRLNTNIELPYWSSGSIKDNKREDFYHDIKLVLNGKYPPPVNDTQVILLATSVKYMAFFGYDVPDHYIDKSPDAVNARLIKFS